MITIQVNGYKAKLTSTDTLPTGPIDYIKVHFDITGNDWTNAEKTATFSAVTPHGARKTIPATLDASGNAYVPELILSTKGAIISAGLVGVFTNKSRITTNMVDICKTVPGAAGDDLTQGMLNPPESKDVLKYIDEKNAELKSDISDIQDEVDEIEDDIPTKTSQLQNDSGFITEEAIPTVPTKTSQLTNDSGFITESAIPTVPTKTSQLTNDSGFITESAIPTVPTKTSQLQNDSGFITEEAIPTVPTKLSEMTDDLGASPVHTHSQYLTEHQSLDGKQDKLTSANAGANITIENGVISASGGSGDSNHIELYDAENSTDDIEYSILTSAEIDEQRGKLFTWKGNPVCVSEYDSSSDTIYLLYTEVKTDVFGIGAISNISTILVVYDDGEVGVSGEDALFDENSGRLNDKQDKSNIAKVISGAGNDTNYPSTKAVVNYVTSAISGKQDSAMTQTVTNTDASHYPSAKAVAEYVTSIIGNVDALIGEVTV